MTATTNWTKDGKEIVRGNGQLSISDIEHCDTVAVYIETDGKEQQ